MEKSALEVSFISISTPTKLCSLSWHAYEHHFLAASTEQQHSTGIKHHLHSQCESKYDFEELCDLFKWLTDDSKFSKYFSLYWLLLKRIQTLLTEVLLLAAKYSHSSSDILAKSEHLQIHTQS